MTSLNGPGFSITLLKANPDILEYIKSSTNAPGWGGSTAIQIPDLAQESQTSHTEPRKSAGLEQASSGVLRTVTTSGPTHQAVLTSRFSEPRRFQGRCSSSLQ